MKNFAELRTFFLDSLYDEQRIDPMWVDSIDTLIAKIEDAYPMEPDLNPIEKLFGQVLFKIAEDARGDWAKMGIDEPQSYNGSWTSTHTPSSTN